MTSEEEAKQKVRDFAARIEAAANHTPAEGTDVAAIRHMLTELFRGAAVILRGIADE